MSYVRNIHYTYKLYQENTIVINGKVTSTEIIKEEKKTQQRPRKARKNKSYDSIIESESIIARGLQQIKTLSWIVSYQDNAYRQWGNKQKWLYANVYIKDHLRLASYKAREIRQLKEDIKTLSEKKSRAVFQLSEKLCYKLDDFRTLLATLQDRIAASGVLDFEHHESVGGSVKRIGLKQIYYRITRDMDYIKQLCLILKNISHLNDRD